MTHTEAVNTLASERYLLDEMTQPEREAFEAHFFDCEACADDVRAGAVMGDGVRAGLLEPVAGVVAFTPMSKRTPRALVAPAAMRQPWYRSAALPWAVAATLAVTVGYQAQRSPEGGSRGAAAEVLAPVVLRPASRGAVPAVSVGQAHVALALDVDAAGAVELAYELREADAAAVVLSGRTSAPAAGAPLLLVIPTFTLKPQQQYILTVRETGSALQTVGEYRFAAAP
jgi:hypothetical protein